MTNNNLTTEKRLSGNIVLVGMMGAGKTTVGRILARQLGKTFIDCDEEIQKRTGVKISHIFDVEGEEGFRQRESSVIQDLIKLDNIVLATGGGAVLKADNRDVLKRNGVVVYLKSGVHDLWQRTRHDHNRPLLQTANPRAKLQELFEQRDALYAAVADHVVHTGKQSVQTLIARLIKKLNNPVNTFTAKHNMQKLDVGLAERSYQIHIGQGVMTQAELLIKHIPNKRVAVVSNTTVAPLYLELLSNTLASNGIRVQSIILPDGEQ